MTILKNLSPHLNGPNVPGGSGVTNGGGLTDQTGGVANARNTLFGSTGGSANVMNDSNKGLYAVRGGQNSPSSQPIPFPSVTQGKGQGQGGGGRSRRKSRKNRHRRAGKSRSRSNKRSLKYRLRNKRSRSRSRRGGYAQFMTGLASSFGQSVPGFPLSSKMSALANPPPFRPYQNCPGGK
jgi:hypothetical protein